MTILLFLFGVAVAAGLFFILADILKLPRLSTEKALLSAGRAEKKRMKSLDAIFLGWAIKLSKFIRMDEYKRHRMERTLSAAGMDMTPEVYFTYTILKPAAALLAVIPCLLIFPLLSPIVQGLIGVLRGDDGRVYFQMLSHDMKQLELQRLKAQAAKIPPKIRVYSFVMLVCFMLIYIVVILMQILTSMGGLFG